MDWIRTDGICRYFLRQKEVIVYRVHSEWFPPVDEVALASPGAPVGRAPVLREAEHLGPQRLLGTLFHHNAVQAVHRKLIL